MQGRTQHAVEQVLAIEREADAIVRQGVDEARAMRVRATQAANAAREEVLAQARREAEEVIASAVAEAERERDQRLAETTEKIEALERSAHRSRRAAIRFVVVSLLGCGPAEQVNPTPSEQRAA